MTDPGARSPQHVVDNFGGEYGPRIEVPHLGRTILWCETGLCAVAMDGRLLWSWDASGIVDDVRLLDTGRLRVESGGVTHQLAAADGSEDPAA